MRAPAAADIRVVGRSLGLPLLLVSLVLGGILYATQLRQGGPAAPAVTQAETQAVAAVAGANFQAADAAMQAWLADHATYAGAVLDPSYQVVVARADPSSYCLQTVAGAAVEHEAGPGGQPAAGAC